MDWPQIIAVSIMSVILLGGAVCIGIMLIKWLKHTALPPRASQSSHENPPRGAETERRSPEPAAAGQRARARTASENKVAETVRTFENFPIYTEIIPEEAAKWAAKLLERNGERPSFSACAHIHVCDSWIEIGNTTYLYKDYGLPNLPDTKHDGEAYMAAVRDTARDHFMEEVRGRLAAHRIPCEISHNSTGYLGLEFYAEITCRIGNG